MFRRRLFLKRSANFSPTIQSASATAIRSVIHYLLFNSKAKSNLTNTSAIMSLDFRAWSFFGYLVARLNVPWILEK